MDLTHFASLLMDAKGARDAAERTLRWLKEEYSARSVSLWASSDGVFSLKLGFGIDQESFGGAQELWGQDPGALLGGMPVSDGARILIPVRTDGHFVYFDGIDAKEMNISLAAEGGNVAAQAIARGDTPLLRGRTRRTDGLFRDELLLTLRLHEWNLARVARVRGVTRKTVYDWLAKYEIEREKIRKS